MKEIIFVTGNSLKVKSISSKLEPFGYRITNRDVPLMEPQSDTVREVVESKAAQAFAVLRQPLIVHDAGFSVSALNGFPGPYMKYVMSRIKATGLIQLLEGAYDRGCHFTNGLAYVDAKGDIHTFIDDSDKGTVAIRASKKSEEAPNYHVRTLFIPEGYTKTLADFTEEESRRRVEERWEQTVAGQLLRFLEAGSS